MKNRLQRVILFLSLWICSAVLMADKDSSRHFFPTEDFNTGSLNFLSPLSFFNSSPFSVEHFLKSSLKSKETRPAAELLLTIMNKDSQRNFHSKDLSLLDINQLRKIQAEAFKNVEDAISQGAAAISIDSATGKVGYYREGKPFVRVDAHVYIFENQFWSIPKGINLPEPFLRSLNTQEGALVLISGPFYVKREGGMYYTDVRELNDEEVFQKFGLKRVKDEKGEPFLIPMLGIAGRSILLPVSYSMHTVQTNQGTKIISDENEYQDPTFKSELCFGLEFKNAGTPSYERHNINSSFPSTVASNYVGKPGVFLDWPHQLSAGTPVGLGSVFDDHESVGREPVLMAEGVQLTRLTVDSLFMGQYYISFRIPRKEYRRLAVFFDDWGRVNIQRFSAILDEFGLTPEEYFEVLCRNYGRNLRKLIQSGYIQGRHGSIINTDLFGNVADLEDYHEIDGMEQNRFQMSLHDWIDNLVKLVSISNRLPVSFSNEKKNKFLKLFTDEFAGEYVSKISFSPEIEDLDHLKEWAGEIANRWIQIKKQGIAHLKKQLKKASSFKMLFNTLQSHMIENNLHPDVLHKNKAVLLILREKFMEFELLPKVETSDTISHRSTNTKKRAA